MKYPALFIVAAFVPACLSGCSSLTKVGSGFSNQQTATQLAGNSEQMRVVSMGAVFQPMSRVEMPQFQGLQTPLVGGGRQRTQIGSRAINLPYFTPVKVLSTNNRSVLVQIADGTRGFLPSSSVARESAILASARQAVPTYSGQGIDPATGMPYGNEALYLPTLDSSDAPVDQAMLNNIDSIPLPESEKQVAGDPEAEEVDGVILRKSSDAAVIQSDMGNSGDDFSSLP